MSNTRILNLIKKLETRAKKFEKSRDAVNSKLDAQVISFLKSLLPNEKPKSKIKAKSKLNKLEKMLARARG